MHKAKLFHKDFILVVVGQIISLFGNGIVRFALPLYLLNTTGSATLFGLVTALSFLPMVLLTPIGGIIADRVNKRNVMVTLDFFTAGLMLLFLLLLGKVNLVLLLVFTLMLLYAIQGAYQPTVFASMPLLVGSENLIQANAIINQVNALAGLLAPVLGGVLYGLWGLMPIVAVGGVCFCLSAVMEIFIRIPHTKSQTRQTIFAIVRQDFSDSFTFMQKDNPIIMKAIGVICSFNLFLSAMLMVAMPVLITETLQLSNELYGFSQGALAAGGLLGGLLAGVFAKKLRVKNAYLLLLACSALLLPVVACFPLGFNAFTCYLVISMCAFCMMSVATMVTIQMLSFLQGQTPTHLTGKIISCAMALCLAAQPIGQAMYGYLFDIFASRPHLVMLGGAAIAGLIALFSRRIFATADDINGKV